MKAIILVFVAALRLTVVADEPQTLSAVQARAIYEKSITLADTSRAEAVQAAKDDALTELASALDTSLKNKNRKEANVIAAAIKSLTENSVLEAGLLPAIDTIREGYEGRVVSAQKQYTEQISDPRTRYLMALETALDAAFAAKNLEEVNRIDAAMEPLRAEAVRLGADRVAAVPPFKNTIGMSFKLIPAGEFMMGSPESEEGRNPDDEAQRAVKISSAFSIGVHEVTQSEYESVMGVNPSSFKGANSPVENVNWDDAVAFCVALSALPAEREAGRVYRLPTEAEWEYAARAGTMTRRFWGDDGDQSCGYANGADQTTKAQVPGWNFMIANCNDRYAYPAPVGSYRANAFGLYDMLGNVWEWTEDCWNENYSNVPTDGSAWTAGNCSLRVVRGGSWYVNPRYLRSALRFRDSAALRDSSNGFRVARTD